MTRVDADARPEAAQDAPRDPSPGAPRRIDPLNRIDVAPAPPLLRVDGLTIDALPHDALQQATREHLVDNVTFTIRPGERIALVGASGSGKTLTALAIAGLLPRSVAHTAGAITFGGCALDGATPRDAVPRPTDDRQADAPATPPAGTPTTADGITPLRTAMIFQEARAALQPIRRIGKQLDDVLRYAPHRPSLPTATGRPTRAARRAAAVALLAEVGLDDPQRLLRAYPAQLSGGMCQRVLIALALARSPHLLLADEPTTGLDDDNRARVMRLIDAAAAARGTAVLLITHDLPLALAHCDRIVVMRAGRCVEIVASDALPTSARHRYTRTLWAAHRLPAFAPRASASVSTSAPTDVALALHALGKDFVSLFGRRTVVLRDVEAVVHAGEIVGLAGASGSGKSTLARIVARLLRQDSGAVIWQGIDLSSVGAAASARAPWRHAVQYVHQDARASLDPLRTVADILNGARRSPPTAPARGDVDRPLWSDPVDAALREVGLSPLLRDRLAHQLSGGEAARVALARALARQPGLLILDEPTAALDTLSRARIIRLIHRLARARGLAVLCIAHDHAALEALCDRVLCLTDGRIATHEGRTAPNGTANAIADRLHDT